MKITKRQLKRIIKEERSKILREMGHGVHGGMYGNPGDFGDPNQYDEEVQEEDFCPYDYLERMRALSPSDYAVDAKLPAMGYDPDDGRELSDREMQQVYDVLDSEEEERVRAEEMRMMETRRLSKRQLKRIIREEKRRMVLESRIEASAVDMEDQLLNILDDRMRISVPEAAEMLGLPSQELEMMISSPAMSEVEVVRGMVQRVEDRYDDFEMTNPEPRLQPGVDRMFGAKRRF